MKMKPLGQALIEPGTGQTMTASRNGIDHAVKFREQLLVLMTMFVIAGEVVFRHQRLFLREVVFAVKLQTGECVEQFAVRCRDGGLQKICHLFVEGVDGGMVEGELCWQVV